MSTNATPALVPATRRTDRSVSKTSPKRRPASKPALTMSYAQFEKLTIQAQIKRAFMAGNRLIAFVALVIGGSVPVATYVVLHDARGVQSNPMLYILVGFGLLYSAPKVFHWMEIFTNSKVAALGFTGVAELFMTFVHIPYIAFLFLGILIFINAVAAACSAQVRKEVKEVKE